MNRYKTDNSYKVLVFEFITGGGFAQQALSSSLALEGGIMLNALVKELAACPRVKLTVVLDWRVDASDLPEGTQVLRVSREQCVFDLLATVLDQFDFVWPVAPEIDGALYRVTQLIENTHAVLLNSSSQAVYLCSDKLATAQLLNDYAIPTVKSVQLDLFGDEFKMPCVIKPKEGAGCLNSYYLDSYKAFVSMSKQVDSKSEYIIQPFVKGKILSLSCLFKDGKAWLLCANEQHVTVEKGLFKLNACVVNNDTSNNQSYSDLVTKIAKAIPGLFAYVGIDIIHPENAQAFVLEINPRLTTSYVGINQAIGINVANIVIEMLNNAPIFKKTRNESYEVSIAE